MDIRFFQNSKILIIKHRNLEYAFEEIPLTKFLTVFWQQFMLFLVSTWFHLNYSIQQSGGGETDIEIPDTASYMYLFNVNVTMIVLLIYQNRKGGNTLKKQH